MPRTERGRSLLQHARKLYVRLCLYVCLYVCACVEHCAEPSWSQQLQLGRSVLKLTMESPNPLNSPSDDIEGGPSPIGTLFLFSRRIAIVTLHLNSGISISWRHAPLHRNCMSKVVLQREGETERGRDFPGCEERDYLILLSMGWFFFLKKPAARRYWSYISVSLVSSAINLFLSTAEPENSAVVLTGICCFMDHIGNSKEQQPSYYLTLYELSDPRQITHLWKELASHLSLFKWSVFSQVQILDCFSFSHFLKYVWHAMNCCCVVFLFSYLLCFFKEISFLLDTNKYETEKQ